MMKLRGGGVFCCAALVLGAAHAWGGTLTFDGFADTSLLTLNGNTSTVKTADGTVLRLTSASGNQSGSAFSSKQVDATNFSTFFEFRITEPGGTIFDCNTEAGADGIVFVVQSVASNIGGAGQGIGYAGIGNSVGVEFDTWCNAVNNDPSSNHIGIDLDGNVNHGAGSPFTIDMPDAFDNGEKRYVWVDYDGTTLEVRLNDVNLRPQLPTLERKVDVPAVIESNSAFVGFTSGTGADWGNHDIVKWSYDIFTPQCDGDINLDGIRDTLDLLILLDDWGACTDACESDIDGNMFIDTLDLLSLLNNWGPCP